MDIGDFFNRSYFYLLLNRKRNVTLNWRDDFQIPGPVYIDSVSLYVQNLNIFVESTSLIQLPSRTLLQSRLKMSMYEAYCNQNVQYTILLQSKRLEWTFILAIIFDRTPEDVLNLPSRFRSYNSDVFKIGPRFNCMRHYIKNNTKFKVY